MGAGAVSVAALPGGFVLDQPVEDRVAPPEGFMLDEPPAAGPVPDDLRALARQIAEEEGIDPELFERQVQQESAFNPQAVSHAGAQGLAQLMPGTAEELGVIDPFDPEQNLRGGARYMRQQLDRFNNDPRLALAAYNAGPGRVQRSGLDMKRLPSETQDYVRRIYDNWAAAPDSTQIAAGAAAGRRPSAPILPEGFVLDTAPEPLPQEVDTKRQPMGEMRAIDQPWLQEHVTDPLQAGWQAGRQGFSLLMDELFNLYQDEPEKQATRLRELQRRAEEFGPSVANQQALQEIAEAEGWLEAGEKILDHPEVVIQTVFRSLGIAGPALAGTAAGAMVGGPAGAATATFLGSGATEYSQSMLESIQKAGGDPADPLSWVRALQDEQVLAAARERAAKRGVAVGTFDALTAGLAGRLTRAARPTLPSAAGAAGGELALQAGGGAAGEATAQLSTEGRIESPGEVLLEAVAEIPTGAVEVPSNVAYARRHGADADTRRLKQAADTGEGFEQIYSDYARRHGQDAADAVMVEHLSRGEAGMDDYLATNEVAAGQTPAARSGDPADAAAVAARSKPGGDVDAQIERLQASRPTEGTGPAATDQEAVRTGPPGQPIDQGPSAVPPGPRIAPGDASVPAADDQAAQAQAEVAEPPQQDQLNLDDIAQLEDKLRAQQILLDELAAGYESVYGRAPGRRVRDSLRRLFIDAPDPAGMVQRLQEQASNEQLSENRRQVAQRAVDSLTGRRPGQGAALQQAIAGINKPTQISPDVRSDIIDVLKNTRALLQQDLRTLQKALAVRHRDAALRQRTRQERAAVQGRIAAVDTALRDLRGQPSTKAATHLRNALAVVGNTIGQQGIGTLLTEGLINNDPTLTRNAHDQVLAAAEQRKAVTLKRAALQRAVRRRTAERARKAQTKREQRMEASRQEVAQVEQAAAQTQALRDLQAQRAAAAGVRQAERAREQRRERSRRSGPPPRMMQETRKVGLREWLKTSLTELRAMTPDVRRARLYLIDLRRILEKYRRVLRDRDGLRAPVFFLPSGETKSAGSAVLDAYSLRSVHRRRDIAEANKLLRENWLHYPVERRDVLAAAAELATLHEVHVDRPYDDPSHKHLHALPDDQGEARYNQARAGYDQLTPDEQASYRKLRDHMQLLRRRSLVELARSVLFNSGIGYGRLKLGTTPELVNASLKALHDRLAALPSAQQQQAVANILLPDAPPTTVDQVLGTISTARELLDSQTVAGDYWPLRRRGDYVVEGLSTYTLTDTTEQGLRSQVEQAITENPTLQVGRLQQQPDGSWTVDISDRLFELYPDPAHAMARIDELQADGQFEVVSSVPVRRDEWTPPRDSTAFELYSRLQQRLPDDSRVQQALRETLMAHLLKRDLARGAINRRKVGGYSRDFGQAFGDFVLTQSTYRGNLALSPVETRARESIRDYYDALRARGDKDAPLVGDLIWRLQRQTEQDMRINSRATQHITKALSDASVLTFLASLSYSLVNASQTLSMSIPSLLGKYGTARGLRALATAAWDLGLDPLHLVESIGAGVARIPAAVREYARELRSRGTILPEVVFAPIVEMRRGPDGKRRLLTEREALLPVEDQDRLHRLRSTGLLDSKFAEYLTSEEAGPTPGAYLSREWNQFMNMVRALPELIEYANRSLVGLAASRLEAERQAQTGTVDEKSVVDAAAALTNATQFDYSEFDRALIMRGPIASNVLRFTTYPLGVIQQAARIVDGLRGRTVGTPYHGRAEAGAVAAWTVVMLWMLSGAKGSVLVEPVRLAGVALAEALGAEAECLADLEACAYNKLIELTDEDTARLIMEGPANVLTGSDIGGRVGLDNLLLFGDVPDADQQASLDKAIVDRLGPTVSMFKSWYQAVFADDPEVRERAVEQALPKMFRDLSKALRYGEEGLRTRTGEQRLPPEDISPADVARQMIGFTPTTVSEHYDRRRRVEGKQKRLDIEATRIKRAYKRSLLHGTPAERREASQAIREWNQRVRENRWPRSLRIDRSEQRRQAEQAQRRQDVAERLGGVVPRSKQRGSEIERGEWGR
ncbi:MAG: PLxRFG domain-containing protein [Sedimenticolaceae bacterium]